MKIIVISPSKARMENIRHTLEAHSHAVTLIDGDMRKISAVAAQQEPDVMLVDGIRAEEEDLSQVEYVSTHFPKISILLACSAHTPEFLIKAMRAGVREVLPSPVPASALEGALNRAAAKLSGGAKSRGKILAFLPCKGGSGATFLATNIGYQLAETKSVLLIDLNLQFGDALSFVHEGAPASTLADITHDIGRLDATFLAASAVKINQNYSILAAPEDPSQAVGIKPEHIDAILALAAKQYDFVLLDVGRNLDALSIKALDRAHRIFPVLQAGLPDLRNAKKLLSLFRSLDYASEKLAFIVNRYGKHGEISIDDVQGLLGSTVHTVPNSYKEVNTSINHGSALSEIARSNTVTRNLSAFVLALSPKPDEAQGLLWRLFKPTAAKPVELRTTNTPAARP